MTLWEFVLAGACVGLACAELQPEQPQSGIATVMLIFALFLVAGKS